MDNKKLPWEPYPEILRFIEEAQGIRLIFEVPRQARDMITIPPDIRVEWFKKEDETSPTIGLVVPSIPNYLKPVLILTQEILQGKNHPLKESYLRRFGSIADLLYFSSTEIYDEWLDILVCAGVTPEEAVYRSILEIKDLSETRYILSERGDSSCKPEMAYETILWLTPWHTESGAEEFKKLRNLLTDRLGPFINLFKFSERPPGGIYDTAWLRIGQFYDFHGILTEFLTTECNAQKISLPGKDILALTSPLVNKSTRHNWPGVYFELLASSSHIASFLLKTLWIYRDTLSKANFFTSLVEKLANSMIIKDVSLRKSILSHFKPDVISKWHSISPTSWYEVLFIWLGEEVGEELCIVLESLNLNPKDEKNNQFITHLSRFILGNPDRKKWSSLADLFFHYLVTLDSEWFKDEENISILSKILQFEPLDEKFIFLPVKSPYQFFRDSEPWYRLKENDPLLDKIPDWENILVEAMPKISVSTFEKVTDIKEISVTSPFSFILVGYGALKGKEAKWTLLPHIKASIKFSLHIVKLLEPVFQNLIQNKNLFWRAIFGFQLDRNQMETLTKFFEVKEKEIGWWEGWSQIAKLFRLLLKLRVGACADTSPNDTKVVFYRASCSPQTKEELLPAMKYKEEQILPYVEGRTIEIPSWFPDDLKKNLEDEFGDYANESMILEKESLERIFLDRPFHLNYWGLLIKGSISECNLNPEDLKQLSTPNLLEPIFSRVSGIIDFHGVLKAILRLSHDEESKSSLARFFCQRWERLLSSHSLTESIKEFDTYGRVYTEICDLLSLSKAREPVVELIPITPSEDQEVPLRCLLLPSGHTYTREGEATIFILFAPSLALQDLMRRLDIDERIEQYFMTWIKEQWKKGLRLRGGLIDLSDLFIPEEILNVIQKNWHRIPPEQQEKTNKLLESAFGIKAHKPDNFEEARKKTYFKEEVVLGQVEGLCGSPDYSFGYNFNLSEPSLIQGRNEISGKVVKCFPSNSFTEWLFKSGLLSEFQGKRKVTIEDARLVQKWYRETKPSTETVRETLNSMFELGREGTPLSELSFEALKRSNNLIGILQDQNISISADSSLIEQGRLFSVSEEGYVPPIVFSGEVTLASGTVSVKVEPHLVRILKSEKESQGQLFIKLIQNIDYLVELIKKNIPEREDRLKFLLHLKKMGGFENKISFIKEIKSPQDKTFFDGNIEFGKALGAEVVHEAAVWKLDNGVEGPVVKGVLKFTYPETYAKFVRDLGLSEELNKAMFTEPVDETFWWKLLQNVDESKISYVLDSSWIQTEVLHAQKIKFPLADPSETLTFINVIQDDIKLCFGSQEEESTASLQLTSTYRGVNAVLTGKEGLNNKGKLIPPSKAFQADILYPSFADKVIITFCEETGEPPEAVINIFRRFLLYQFIEKLTLSLSKYSIFVALLETFNMEWKKITEILQQETFIEAEEYQRISKMAKRIATKITWILPWTYLSDGKFSGIPVHFETTDREILSGGTSPPATKLDLIPVAFQMKPVPNENPPLQINYELYRFSYGAR